MEVYQAICEWSYAPRLVHDAAGGAAFAADVSSRVRRVPEIVDFRVQGGDKGKGYWKRQLLRGDAQGRTACSMGPAGPACLSCGNRLHVLCECALRGDDVDALFGHDASTTSLDWSVICCST